MYYNISVCEAPNRPVMFPLERAFHFTKVFVELRVQTFAFCTFYCRQRWTGFPGLSHASADYTSVPYGAGERAHFCSLFVVPFFLFCVFL